MIKITDNERLIKTMLEKLRKDPHCPCKIEKTDDTICPCKEFREEIKEGKCHCGLYEKITEPKEKNSAKDVLDTGIMEDCSYTKYDLMKQLVSSIVHPVNEIKEDYKELIYNSGVEWGNAYVSCKEINDITPFLNTKLSVFADLVEDLLQDRGTILDYEYQQNENCYDFWIKCKDGEVRLYKLFDAKNTIIDVRDYQPTDW